MKGSRRGFVVVLAAITVLACGCARYQRRPISFRTPSSYPNYQIVEGVGIAARAIADRREARETFGFDIIKAQVLPVQVVVSNESDWSLMIVPDQTFLMESDGRMWPILSRALARERVEKKTGWGEIGPGAGKGGLLGAAAGALVGVAIGVVSDQSTLAAAGKGVVAGAAGGALIGGAAGLADKDVGRAIAEDLRDASLENKVVEPDHLGHGVLFFPGEARRPSQLKLRVKNVASGEVRDLAFAL